MDRLNDAISDIAYILDSLILLRQIQQTGDCNICKNRDCKYKPKVGQLTRYNCPFYNAETEGKTKEIELVIKIPEEDYNNIGPFLNGQTIKGGFNLLKVLEIINRGTPLPKRT